LNPRQSENAADFESLYSRALHFGLDYGDLMRVRATASDWSAWGSALATLAESFDLAGNEASADGRTTSAKEYWRRAADYFHFSQIKLIDGAAKPEWQARVRVNYKKLASALNPISVAVAVPFKNILLPAYFRAAGNSAPCVVLIGGLDSAKEVELHYFAECFLQRGLSVIYFDGPGQGELSGKLHMNSHFEEAVSSVLDFLETKAPAPVTRVGLFGVSFGGYLACRSAAADERIKACICLGGFYDAKVFKRLARPALANLRGAFGLDEGDPIESINETITLAPLQGSMKCPLFIIHGCDDHLVDEAQVAALSDWACGPKRVWKIKGAEHVCTNRFSECLPVLADWMLAQLIDGGRLRLYPSTVIKNAIR
jgi:2,6-dihydroxypseudooxynicotine hydrolase